MEMFKHVLVATDGSPLSEQAVQNAVRLAKSMSAKLTAITVSTPFHVFATDAVMVTDTEEVYNEECKKRAGQYLGFVRAAAESSGIDYQGKHVVHDHPYTAIIDTATNSGCDVICMASHGRRGVAALVLGSETVKVLTHSKIPVLVWR
jgi:nucleotide-binding universal stress UspA family protein